MSGSMETYFSKMAGRPIRRPIYVTSDSLSAESQGGRVLSPHRLQVGQGFEARFYDAPIAHSVLLGATYAGRPTVMGTEPSDHWNITVTLAGALSVADDRGEAQGERGWLVITPPTTRLRVSFAADTAFLGVRIPAAILERRLTIVNGRPPERPLELARTVRPSLAADGVIAALRQALTIADGNSLLPVALANAIEEALLTSILVNIPGSHTEDLLKPADPVATRAVQRAAALMREQGMQPRPLVEIAESVGISLRRLQAGFQATYGTTPSRFQRDLRLDHAHRILHDAARNETTVADVAAAAGFSHFGRFSIEYRRRFGVPPSATLRGSG